MKHVDVFFRDEVLVGRLAEHPSDLSHAFEVAPDWLRLDHDLSPFMFPLASLRDGRLKVFRVESSPFPGHLPGLFADSLPDSWGERLLSKELPGPQTILQKLSLIGRRGLGALTYRPVLGNGADTDTCQVEIEEMAREADVVRTNLLSPGDVDSRLAAAGSTLGGAHPKISIFLPLTYQQPGPPITLSSALSGGAVPPGHSPWILKLSRPEYDAEGSVEYAYWLMARAAGLRLASARLIVDRDRHHFATARFDRMVDAAGRVDRLHVHSLSGLLHRRASDAHIDYHDFLQAALRLGGKGELEEAFRRAAFNLVACNRDDHGRNHAFTYDYRSRVWALTPAYDLTPSVANVLVGLGWNGSVQVPDRKQIFALAERSGLAAKTVERIWNQIVEAVERWPIWAAEALVPPDVAKAWAECHAIARRQIR